jgi:hypothetical protein
MMMYQPLALASSRREKSRRFQLRFRKFSALVAQRPPALTACDAGAGAHRATWPTVEAASGRAGRPIEGRE